MWVVPVYPLEHFPTYCTNEVQFILQEVKGKYAEIRGLSTRGNYDHIDVRMDTCMLYYTHTVRIDWSSPTLYRGCCIDHLIYLM